MDNRIIASSIAEVPCSVEAEAPTGSQPPAFVPLDPRAAHRLIWMMAIACGLSVANLYYNQPLLSEMARGFHVTVREVGFIPTMTQVGYALGLLFLVPLGDILQRWRLVVTLLILVAVSLVLAATARSLPWLAAASLAIGIFTVVPQVLIPYTAQLTPPGERGRAVGIVMCGLLIGILLSRTISGFVGEHFGWRAMYWIASGLMVALAVVLGPLVPRHALQPHLPYPKLLASVLAIARKHAVVRQAALNGSLLFAAFSAFWATLVFRLEAPPFHYGARAAGMFGVVGVVGALAAAVVGRLADRHGPRTILTLAATLILAAFAIFWIFGSTLAGLAAGVIVLDLAMQSAQVANQTRIYALEPSVHSRVNTAYMATYFIGGACGSLAGACAWSAWRWPGVCAVGLAFAAIAIVAHLLARPELLPKRDTLDSRRLAAE
jgi:predicted MFS family arabinose efflux permease